MINIFCKFFSVVSTPLSSVQG